MKLLTKAVIKSLPPLYSQEKNPDPMCMVKLFDPTSNWTWYLYELSLVCPEHNYSDCPDCPRETWTQYLGFGYVVGLDKEIGYISIAELQQFRGRFGLGIERDLHWKPKPLSEVKKLHGDDRK